MLLALVTLLLVPFYPKFSFVDSVGLSSEVDREKSTNQTSIINEILGTSKTSAENNADSTIAETYEAALQSYLREDWDSCVEGFVDVARKYKRFKSALVDCRSRCRSETDNTFEPIFYQNIDDLHFFEKKLKETLCLLKCKQDYREVYGKKVLNRLSQKLEFKLIGLDHYAYLHVCYFNSDLAQEAADAAFTYLTLHPDDQVVKTTLAWYMTLPTVDNGFIRNLEAQDFIQDYVQGVESYDEEYYEEAKDSFEYSIVAYLKAEETCRFYCEGPYERRRGSDFKIAITEHFVHDLYCKRRCSKITSTVNGEYRSGLLARHFDYLQFAYYKIGRLDKACEAVATYLLFYPADETMIHNRNYYASLPTVKQSYFAPRERLISYSLRQEYEMRLLLYFEEEVMPLQDSLDSDS